MQRIEQVLGQREDDLVGVLVGQADFDCDTARRFLAVAGSDLLESYRWQLGDTELDDLSARRDAPRLLGFVHANAIADRVGISRVQAWRGLRTLVPNVLRMASPLADRRRSA